MLLRLLLLLIVLLIEAQSAEAAPKPVEIPRSQIIALENSVTGGLYELYVKLPESYVFESGIFESSVSEGGVSGTSDSESTVSKDNTSNAQQPALKHYPVIYTTDADWHMDLLSGTTEFLLPEVIIVGISWQRNMPSNVDYGDSRTYASRFRDYSFTSHSKPEVQEKYQFGKADAFLRFIQQDVMPKVEKQYRVAPNANAYLGYSMGAGFGAYVLLEAPNTFTHYLLGSPALSENGLAALKELEGKTVDQQIENANVFVSIGELETSRMEVTQDFVDLLKQSQRNIAVNGLNVINDSDHTSAVPETFTSGIRWLKQQIATQ